MERIFAKEFRMFVQERISKFCSYCALMFDNLLRKCCLSVVHPGWIAWHSSRQMNDLSFQKSPDKSQISYFLLCNYIGLFIPVARLESDRLLKHAQSLQLAGDKSHTILPGCASKNDSYI